MFDLTLLDGYPDWFKRVALKKTFYYPDVNLLFTLVKDPKRFADGAAFFCRKCGKQAACQCDYADTQKAFLVVKIFCINCHQKWALNVEPIWVRVLEDWEIK